MRKAIKTSIKKAENLRKASYKEQKEFEKLETDLVLLEEEKVDIINQLNSGELSPDELQEKSKRFELLSEELETKELRWLELSEIIG